MEILISIQICKKNAHTQFSHKKLEWATPNYSKKNSVDSWKLAWPVLIIQNNVVFK